MKYLDPKADLTFKKVFGEHQDLVVSFLNALLPFESEEEKIVSVEYLRPELVSFNPLRGDSVLCVSCGDMSGRRYIVEIQVMWTPEYKLLLDFKSSFGVLYEDITKSEKDYNLQQPIYSLNLLNDTFSDSGCYYHDYPIVRIAETKELIEGLRLIFIELPKFKLEKDKVNDMRALWLGYLTQIEGSMSDIPEEFKKNSEISRALSMLEEDSFSEKELLAYDYFWDRIGAYRLLLLGAFKKGYEDGLQAAAREKGCRIERIKNARAMKESGIQTELISRITGLAPDEIASL